MAHLSDASQTGRDLKKASQPMLVQVQSVCGNEGEDMPEVTWRQALKRVMSGMMTS